MTAGKKYYLSIPSGDPSQGDIWTNLPFFDFDMPLKHSLLITPRCDFAHEKAKVFNYIPATSLNDYMVCHGFSRLLIEELNRKIIALHHLDIPLSAYAFLGIGVSEKVVLEKMKDEFDPNDKKVKKKIKKYEELIGQISSIRKVYDQKTINNSEIKAVVKDKEIKRHIDLVIRNQINDLHFLPAFPPLLTEPSVLFLRYLSTCPIQILNTACKCVAEEDWKSQCQKDDAIYFMKYCKEKPDRILRLRSPYLENLMNRIGLLYLRIGTPDLTTSEYNSAMQGAIA